MQADSGHADAVRIVIREGKPPFAARALHGVAALLCLAMLAALCLLAVPRLFGVHEFNVTSSSMSPAYPVGSLVFAVPVDPASVRPGEVVSFVMNEDLDVATHRVVENDYQNGRLVTKGDANANRDDPILYENVVGVVRFSVPMAGGVIDKLSNDQAGRMAAAGAAVCLVVLVVCLEVAAGLLSRRQPTVSVASADGLAPKGGLR
ncbi:MAG TPA: signal peptidase I [Candidatus Rubneribacter avistercoris]|nr:signal peptidase I [Candidatus Rubneribacter avistercoris]